ncbi:acyl-CoA dehydrogenase family protein [Micromonospora sp. NPDC047738]|uniref:acyl-CoA dehydrogenase family protein n=1 Tax=unclassified Micromonospora TaxID=2617518 RepID=UPI0033FCA32E
MTGLLSPAQVLAGAFDDYLGDPYAGGTPFSYDEIVAGDEASELPPNARSTIEKWGFHELLVPVEQGGRLRTLDELLHVCRVLSRRNPTIAVMYGSTLLAANPVWLWGSARQKRELAGELLSGGLACFGVSEADHGSDLLSTEGTLVRENGGFRLNAAKWPVGNATRARFVTVLARTGEHDLSLALVDKQQLSDGAVRNLPFVRTLGLKGHDLSGVEFHDAVLPGDALVGPPGIGVTQVLKTLQITRTAIAAMSLGVMDAVLRMGLGYAMDRRLYGDRIFAIPIIRHQLVQEHVNLFIGECTTLPISRALVLAPERLSLWSAIAKYLVPVMAEETVHNVGVVMGARSYLREGVASGAFQKLQRDHAIASVFEGTTHVNLHWIAEQLPAVVAGAGEPDDAAQDLLRQLFDLGDNTAAWHPDGRRLRLANGGLDEITGAWPLAVRRAEALLRGPRPPAASAEILDLCARLSELRAALHHRITATESWQSSSVAAITAAREHCAHHAAVSCLLIWLDNRDRLGGAFADGGWLVLSLQRLLQRLGVTVAVDERHEAELAQQLERGAEKKDWFTLASLPAG